ncbi:hypothetical protein [Streptomyces sp. NPDC052107]|uniref:hypothetical protein n=1 Tax=Streptomyces sp. NPDC052107 TaxID=3155632 RepID=UPI0034370A24
MPLRGGHRDHRQGQHPYEERGTNAVHTVGALLVADANVDEAFGACSSTPTPRAIGCAGSPTATGLDPARTADALAL